MSILWCGGEDIDFIVTGALPTMRTTTAYRRTEYSRCSIWPCNGTGNFLSTPPFTAVSDIWLSLHNYAGNKGLVVRFISLTDNGAERISLKSRAADNNIDVVLTDGTTDTVIGTLTSFAYNSLAKLDIHVVYGVAGSVTIYLNGVQQFIWNGDTRRGGSTTLNGFLFGRDYSLLTAVSEVIIADEDTRLMSLCTLAPNAAGDANSWTGAYTDIDEVTLNDADILYTDTAAQDAQFNLNSLTTGVFTIKAVKIAARAAKSAGSTVNSICLGVKSGGTVDPGDAQACSTAWETKERLMLQNPVTSNIWQSSEIDALQLNFRSVT